MAKLKNLYIVLTTDNIYLDEIILTIKENFPNCDMFQFDILDKDREITVEKIIEKIKTRSFFCEKNLIIIKNFLKLKKEELMKLKEALKNIPEFSIVVLVSDEIIDKKFDIKGINPVIKDYLNVDSFDIKNRIKNYLEKKEKKIDDEVLEFIIEESNEELTVIMNEIEKILLFIGDKEYIEKEDFNKIKGVEKEYDIWALTNSIADGDYERAMIVFNKLSESEEPEMILGAIFNTIKRIYLMRYYLYKREEEKAQKIFGRAFYIIKRQSKNFIKIPYHDILYIIKEADKKIKLTARKNAKNILYIMLEEIFMRMEKK